MGLRLLKTSPNRAKRDMYSCHIVSNEKRDLIKKKCVILLSYFISQNAALFFLSSVCSWRIRDGTDYQNKEYDICTLRSQGSDDLEYVLVKYSYVSCIVIVIHAFLCPNYLIVSCLRHLY